MNATRIAYRPRLGCTVRVEHNAQPAPRRSLRIQRPLPKVLPRGIIECSCGVSMTFEIGQGGDEVVLYTGVGGVVLGAEIPGTPACAHWEPSDPGSFSSLSQQMC